jgi:hypothetical protein
MVYLIKKLIFGEKKKEHKEKRQLQDIYRRWAKWQTRVFVANNIRLLLLLFLLIWGI